MYAKPPIPQPAALPWHMAGTLGPSARSMSNSPLSSALVAARKTSCGSVHRSKEVSYMGLEG